VAQAAPVAAALAWPRLSSRLGSWADLVTRFAPWAHGLGPAYLALLRGAIRARDAGLAGFTPLDWAAGILACVIWAWLAASKSPEAASWPEPGRGVLDEPRWTLYRAAGNRWLGQAQAGWLVGLGLGLVEWGLAARLRGRPDWQTLARVASSAVVFALTRNFWLTVLAQAGWLALLRRGARG
jgi:hypothetical protein